MTRLYVALGFAGLLGALVYGAYLYGCDVTRERYLNAQLREEVRVSKRQKSGTVQTLVKYIRVKEKHDALLPALSRDIVGRCVGLLPDGAAVRAGAAGAGVPGDGGGAVGPAAAAADEANRRWCEQLAADYASGVYNTDALVLALGWLRAHGAAPRDR